VPKEVRWSDNPARAELRAIYTEVDALLAPYSCEGTAECCDFANTGREPTPTTVELAETLHAARALGGERKRHLPMADASRRCALLSDEGRCRIYASRPFGCRTYFCERMTGPKKLPRAEILALARRIAALSERTFPRDPLPRPLARALEDSRFGQDMVAYLARARSR
jgi:uncharacterized protein